MNHLGTKPPNLIDTYCMNDDTFVYFMGQYTPLTEITPALLAIHYMLAHTMQSDNKQG